jgi:hypothetical protein
MATARIISRSQLCSRELARELLARGYAVEIVSPDEIPAGLADLELRVDADTTDQLTATVEARNGGRSASLEFVHHLTAPMGNFVRRPPETSEKVCFPDQPVNFNAEPGVAEDVEPPSENSRAPEPARELEILPHPEGPKLEVLPGKEDRARPITPPQLPMSAEEPVKHVRPGMTITFHRSKRPRKTSIASQVWAASRVWGRSATQVWERTTGQVSVNSVHQVWERVVRQVSTRARLQSCRNGCRNIAGFSRRALLWVVHLVSSQLATLRQTGIANSGVGFGRAAVIFAAVIVIAIVLGRGIDRGGAASVNQDSQSRPGQNFAGPDVNMSTNPQPEQAPAAVTAPTPASKPEVKPAPISKTQRAATKSKKSKAARSRMVGDDLVADDTVTYFNRPASVARAKDSSRRRAGSHKQSGSAASASTSPI